MSANLHQQDSQPVALASVPVTGPLVDASAAPQRDGSQVAAHHGDPELQAELLASLKDMVAVNVALLVALETLGRFHPATLARVQAAVATDFTTTGIQPGPCARAEALVLRLEGRL